MARLWLRYALSAPVESTMWGWILRDQGNSWHLLFVAIMTQVSSINRESDDFSIVLLVDRILLVILMTIVTIHYHSTQYSSFPQISWCLDWLMCHINKSLSWLSKIFFCYSKFSYVVGYQSLKQVYFSCFLYSISRMLWKKLSGARKVFRIQDKVISVRFKWILRFKHWKY